jgi:hypothetical protein
MSFFNFATKCLAVSVALALTGFSAIGPVQASNAMVQACRSDADRLCPGVLPGAGRVAECLEKHASSLSPSCKAQLGTITQCGQEIKAICGPQASTQSQLRSCFINHADAFSPTCRSAALGN